MNRKKLEDFIKTWSDHGSEVADKVTYWNTLLEILGVPENKINDNSFIKYEKPISVTPADKRDKFHGSIDGYIPSTKVLIEQKSFGVDLFKKELRKNGNDSTPITPFQQADRYNQHLALEEKARYYVLCNFSQIVVYDMRKNLNEKPQIIELKDLKKQIYLLKFLVDEEAPHLEKEKEVSLGAGELVGKIYDELRKQYADPDSERAKKSINALCVRLVFCLYAEDAGLFEKEQFHDYLIDKKPHEIRKALVNLFRMLDTPDEPTNVREEKFGKYYQDDDPELAKFPYVNGGMFSDEDIEIPPFTQELKDVLLVDASEHFDWSDISPTIFGAIFESTLNPETRREGGMHYTSVENIHKVIDPLFLDDLKQKLNQIENKYKLTTTLTKRQQKALDKKIDDFQDHLKHLTFFDPACGSGNFLTETYLSLRKLENRAISLKMRGKSLLEVNNYASKYIKVSIQQFYGIEINDFAVSVAKTALWIAEDKMMKETQSLISGAEWDFLPLKTYTHIHEGNALRMNWDRIINDDPTKPNIKVSYIISNPPFVGARLQNNEQKADVKRIFNNKRGAGNIDYVACWYRLAANYMENSGSKACFVSTNSITQGEQVALVWEDLFKRKDFQINFAYRTFRWDSEAKIKAHVHVVIIGFSYQNVKPKILFNEKGKAQIETQINSYLLPSANVFIKNRSKPLSTNKIIKYGSFALDHGNYTLTEKEFNELNKKYKISAYVKPFIGARELLHNQKRYCIWLKGLSPAFIKKNNEITRRVEIVKAWRKNSGRKNTKELAKTPTIFAEIRQPNTNYLAIPTVCSEKRKYIPMMYLTPETIASNQLYIVSNATLYDFGILESIVHMAWMRVVAGRLKSDYRYSSKVVYNNFPWCSSTNIQKEKITKTAQGILNARAEYPDSSLADLYDPLTMPPELVKAHEVNDKAVLEAYGLPKTATEPEIVAHLFKMYEQLVK